MDFFRFSAQPDSKGAKCFDAKNGQIFFWGTQAARSVVAWLRERI